MAIDRPPRHNVILGNLPAWISIIVSIIVAIKSCDYDERIIEISSKLNSIQYRPILKFIEYPKVTSIGVKLVFDKDTAADIGRASAYRIQRPLDTLDVTNRLILSFKLTYANVGDRPAMIRSFIYLDDTTLAPILRKRLQNRNKSDWAEFSEKRYPGDMQTVLPNDTLSLDITDVHTTTATQGKVIMHFLILYLGETKIFYDSYIRVLYKWNPHVYFGPAPGGIAITRDVQLLQASTTFSSYIYSESESNEILSFLNNLEYDIETNKRK